MGNAHFPNDKIRILSMPMRPSTLFFCCGTPEKSTGKADVEVCGWSLCLFLDREVTFKNARVKLA